MDAVGVCKSIVGDLAFLAAPARESLRVGLLGMLVQPSLRFGSSNGLMLEFGEPVDEGVSDASASSGSFFGLVSATDAGSFASLLLRKLPFLDFGASCNLKAPFWAILRLPSSFEGSDASSAGVGAV